MKRPPPVADAESTAEAPPDDGADPPMEIAVWHTGEVTVRRADQVLVLSATEVETLMRFLGRFTLREARR